MDPDKEMVPRNYQDALIRICVQQNSIIFLPTGAGKTFTAICALKQLVGDDFSRTYSEGGKLCVFLVNTVTLVSQHQKYMQQNTPYKIGAFTGDMNVDFWSKERWLEEYEKHHVLIMTAQIFRNCLTTQTIDFNQVNVLIFDECHHGVDKHPMREIMYYFKELKNPPRVIGLTATLLNGNVKPAAVMQEVMKLEATFHAKVATVDALMSVVGFSTNPREDVIEYIAGSCHPIIDECCTLLNQLETLLREFKCDPTKAQTRLVKPRPDLQLLTPDKPFEKYYKLLMDAQVHFKMLGVSGARIACIIYTVHMELEKRSCSDCKKLHVINAVISLFAEIRAKLEAVYYACPSEQRTLKLSSNKVIKLIQTLNSYKNKSKKELCAIVFVERKNTALFLYHILREIKESFDSMDFIKPNFIIGNTANPLNCTPESLYYAKLNRKIMEQFNSKETNLLFASNVIEEGIDVQMCSMVIKFDLVKDYRAYVQSKGRARHVSSLYYIMVEKCERRSFMEKYHTFQHIEANLNNYLIGTNEERSNPRQEAIDEMYAETRIYYVDGPNSANVTETAAMSLLTMYCNHMNSDMYTTYEPVCYVEKHTQGYRVLLELPTFCPIRGLVQSEVKATKVAAKRSAAFNACKELHQIGELSDSMLPCPGKMTPESTEYLFRHWPQNGQKSDGVSKTNRSYPRRIPNVVEAPILPDDKVFLHVIDMQPHLDAEQATLTQMYSNDFCFGLVTAQEWPELCTFPTFISLGQITVTVRVNQAQLVVSAADLNRIKNFHHLIFGKVLDVLARKDYLVLGDAGTFHAYLVPVRKAEKRVDFEFLKSYQGVVDPEVGLSTDEKMNLVVNNDTYLETIVTPNYREDRKHYLVMEVCDYLTAASPFPNPEYGTYATYYESKYGKHIVNKHLPMLLVRQLPSSLNCLKPRGAAAKRRRAETMENLVQHFSPELCAHQTFPAPLWVAATLLPTVLRRVEQLLLAEELRATIAKQTKLGVVKVDQWEPMQVDSRLIRYETTQSLEEREEQRDDGVQDAEMPEMLESNAIGDILNRSGLNKAFREVMIDSQYPWSAEKEPVDWMRNLDVTQLDIATFDKFIHMPLTDKNSPETSVQRPGTSQLAINYTPQEYVYQPIRLLTQVERPQGPELKSLYEALSTAKAHEIVNLERLETLGDSFLKMAASIYIFHTFPLYSEGQATQLKGRLVSNRNLFYCAQYHKLGGRILNTDFSPKDEWLPSGYCTPEEVQNMIKGRHAPISCLFEIGIPHEEQISGVLSKNTREIIAEYYDEDATDDGKIDNNYVSMCNFLGERVMGDKNLADVVESILGVYVEAMGINGGLKMAEWLKILPKNAMEIFSPSTPIPSPIIKDGATGLELGMHLSNFEALQIEEILGYKFNNRAYLLQALTHSSYNSNRLTQSYQRLEFIGDAVLDLLITFFIFERNTQLNPGDLTDLRSALVNNETFAAYVVKLRLHKYLKHFNSKLTSLIAKFDAYQKMQNYEMTSDVIMLLNEDNLHIAENVDCPKVLGDLFESIAGAIFLDSKRDFDVVWRVFHRIMWKEIEAFSKDIPINPIRRLYETLAPLKPQFSEPVDVDETGCTLMKLDFNLYGTVTRVHGFGDNKTNAKKAAAKIALRLLNVKKQSVS